ncbi:hypothetical protein PHET_06094, partial [Paragonimus heterotremus]
GKAAYCAEECVQEFGCWGPGPSFCRACRFWSIRTSEGTQMCIRNCHLEKGYFTPNQTQESSEGSTEVATTATFTNSHLDATDRYVNFPGNTRDAVSTVNHKEAQACKPCSPMCRSVVNACTGPGPDQCNGPCRWVKDGPYCRKSCPPTKYLNHTTQTCQECSTACSHPLVPALANSLVLTGDARQLHNELLSHDIDVERTVCTGPGNWPGPGGCNYCRQTMLHLDQHNKIDGSHKIIQCDQKCPRGTFVHVINLHYRSASGFEANLQSSAKTEERRDLPWSQTDAAFLTRLSTVVQTELITWLMNHTQPLLYGLARICVPCHGECAVESGEHLSNEVSACTGPGPEQCLRCNNASHEGRCVSHCPDGTYPNATHPFSGPGRLSESSTGPQSRIVCRACHPFCRFGCSGPSSAECVRCRRVKVYLNRQLTVWKCASICPSAYKFRVRDHQTGDLVCSSSAYQVRIISEGDIEDDISHEIHESGQLDQPNITNLDDLFLWDHQLFTFERGVFLSAETVSTIAALSGLVILLLAIGLLIAWAVIKQIPPDEDQQWSSMRAKLEWAQLSRTSRLNILCERLWTRGKPRRRLVVRPKHLSTQVDVKKFVDGNQSVNTGRNLCYSLECGQPSAINELHTHLNDKRRLLLSDDESHKSITDKPNMATLRIITESQLIRGPLIGSGAFGTVFCGIWRPQITTPSMDTLSVTSPGSLQTPSTTYSMDWGDRLDSLSDKPMLTSCSEVVVSPDGHMERQQDNVRLNEAVKQISVEIPVAIKVLTDSADPQTNKELLEEAKVMATVDHPCCLRFLALCLTSRLQLVTQYMPLGSLLDFVKSYVDLLQVNMFMAWAEQIASGMTYLASRGIIHRDLAARNVLVESLTQVRITDFGLAKCMDCIESEYHASGGRMPIKWLAIECIQGKIFSSKSDVWSYGVTLWEMCTFGARPFEGIRARDLLDRLEKGMRLPQPETTSIEFYSLLLNCWEADPNRRPTFQELGLLLGRMRITPERYLFITSGIRQRQRHHARNRSSDALEFLTNTLQSSSGCSSGNGANQMTQSDVQTTVSDSTEYAKIQTDWMRTLCENSQVAPFPPCVQNLLSNYAHLRKDESLGESQRQLSLTQSIIDDIESAPHWTWKATPSEVMSLLEPPNIMPLLTSFGKHPISSAHHRAPLEEESDLQELDFEHVISIPVPNLNRQQTAENPVYLTEMTAQLNTNSQSLSKYEPLNEDYFQLQGTEPDLMPITCAGPYELNTMDVRHGENCCAAISPNDATTTWLGDYLEPRTGITQNAG